MAHHGKWFVSILITVASPILTSCVGGNTDPVAVQTEMAGSDNSFEGLVLGEVNDVNFTGTAATVSFSGGEPDDQYLLVVNTTNPGGGDYSVSLTSESIRSDGQSQILALIEGRSRSPLDGSPSDETPANEFHQYLREMEGVIGQSPDFEEVRRSPQAALTASAQKGDIESFRVLATMNSISAYEEVSAELRLVTDNLLVYTDQSVADHVTDEDIQTLAEEFEGNALPRERELFGNESDINLDGHVTILMTCVLNRMSASGGIVTGFFFPGDLYQRSSVNPASNAQEIFYTMMPDPAGECGTPVSESFAINNILPGVLAHEYQHMVSFNQHVFRKSGSTEEPWLNEGLSHLAEDITGFGNENPSRVRLFLAQPSRTALIPSTSPTLAERGGIYLFLRYLYEQSPEGDDFLKSLLATAQTGVANLESAFAGTDTDFDEFPELLNRWSVAVALSETGVTSDPEYNYEARSLHPVTGNFTGVCLRCDTQDGRGTVLGGPVITTVTSYPQATTLKATASQFYRLYGPGSSLRLNGGSGAALVGTLVRLELP